ncbi:DNA excision repair protein ERCC-6-like [Macrobrachium nipponense]|uniref:DNA excision repair protein ERCC-6-like n=1 Tax=Macrobrachium nipponense TaxID=159736 RepID=UPI0030C7AD64
MDALLGENSITSLSSLDVLSAEKDDSSSDTGAKDGSSNIAKWNQTSILESMLMEAKNNEETKEVDQDLKDQDEELRALGISVVDQLSLERDVEAAVDKAVTVHARKQRMQMLKKEIQDVKKEIKQGDLKVHILSERLSGMRRRVVDPRQYFNVEKEMKSKDEQLRVLKNREEYLMEKLSAAESNEAELDDLELEDGEIVEEGDDTLQEVNIDEKKSQMFGNEKERLIREGKMTPFGTVMSSTSSKTVSFVRPNVTQSEKRKSQAAAQKKKSEKESLISTGEMTPFGSVVSTTKTVINSDREKKKTGTALTDFEKYLQDQIDRQKEHSKTSKGIKRKKSSGDPKYGIPKRKQKPKEYVGDIGFDQDGREASDEEVSLSAIKSNVKSNYEAKVSKAKSSDLKKKPRSKDPIKMKVLHPKQKKTKKVILGSVTSELEADQYKEAPRRVLSEKVSFEGGESEISHSEDDSNSEYIPSDKESSDDDGNLGEKKSKVREIMDRPKRKRTKKVEIDNDFSPDEIPKSKGRRSLKELDDGNIDDYVARIENWKEERLKQKHAKILRGEDLDSEEEEEGYEEFDGGYKIPLTIWNKLYKYQRTCVKWLWELHTQGCGGILGDEMGLGKTIQVISFLVGLSYSRLNERHQSWKGLGPVLIVCPATVLHQWVKEFHKWWPPFRVAILHESGSFIGKRSSLIYNINKYDGILITSYSGVSNQIETLVQYKWHYIILDEGHKIRNPEAQITVALKRFQTQHRLILSGSPIQNSLKELWSLFDFVFPGKLGTLPVFLAEFAVPITQGGYANASKLEVQTAFKCASVLRDTINPYLLRRMKNDVRNHLSLPDKNEQVLFCSLTEEQRNAYHEYLNGDQVKWIMGGRMKVFVGLINLRKICNHPDLYTGGPRTYDGFESGLQPELKYGWWGRSGKMHVLQSILRLWSKQGHRVLLFTQSRQMMCILEKFLIDEGHSYLKMDGTTTVSSRQPLIDKFNGDTSYFVFLLTTRVGGLGVNLTGADRVVIFDPDWNPSTDSQARERAWRIGQMRHVTIYRLLTSGTIEEKIYHRQIFKQFLTNRVLKDPKQQRFFKTNDLYELFTLNEGEKEKTESSAIFAGTNSEIKVDVNDDNQDSDEEISRISKATNKQLKKSDRYIKKGHYDKSSNQIPAKKEKPRKVSNKDENKQSDCSLNTNLKVQEDADLKERMRNLAKKISLNIAKKTLPVEKNTGSPERCDRLKDHPQGYEIGKSNKSEENRQDILTQDVIDIKNEVDEEHMEIKTEIEEEQMDIKTEIGEEWTDIKTDKGDGSMDMKAGIHEEHMEKIEIVEHDIKVEHEDPSEVEHEDSSGKSDPSNAFSVTQEEIGLKLPHLAEDMENIFVEHKSNVSEYQSVSSFELNKETGNGKNSDCGNCSQLEDKLSEGHRKKHKKKDKHKEREKLKDRDKKKHSHKKGKKIDGERIDYLVKKRIYRKTEEEEAAEKENAKSQDEYVLTKLFKKSGVHTALSHDSILSNNDPDYLLMEGEAERVAKEALKAVRASRARCSRPWKSHNETSDPKKSKHKFGGKKSRVFADSVDREVKKDEIKSKKEKERMFDGGLEDEDSDNPSEMDFIPKKKIGNKTSNGLSSAQLLSRIHQRNKTVASTELTNDEPDEDYDPDYPSTAVSLEAEPEEVEEEIQENIDLLTDIRNFVAFQAEVDGSASTQEIINRFRARLPPSQTPFFKALLTKICDFHRKSSGEGIWSLKEEFR